MITWVPLQVQEEPHLFVPNSSRTSRSQVFTEPSGLGQQAEPFGIGRFQVLSLSGSCWDLVYVYLVICLLLP